MTAFLFVGPSLEPGDVDGTEKLILWPPVRQGDVLRAVQSGATAIGIVDGYFDRVPAVWHKEILWALGQGVAVLGSSSMGALRAAELHSLGMVGVGTVFEWYRDGVFWQDDAVALTHGPGELGYPKLTEPLVNIHATAMAAANQGVLSLGSARDLVACAGRQFYKKRTWATVLEAMRSESGALAGSRFEHWLPNGYVDQKRSDALALVDMLRSSPKAPATQDFDFEWTDMWDRLFRQTAARRPTHPTTEPASREESILDEARLTPGTFLRVKDRAMLRLLVCSKGRGRMDTQSDDTLLAAVTALRAELGLATRAEFDAWLTDNDLNAGTLEKVLSGRVALDDWQARHRADLNDAMLDEFMVDGAYSTLAWRADEKNATLAVAGLDVGGSSGDPAPSQLVDWFHSQRLCDQPPDDMDRFCREIGLDNRSDWYRLLWREFHFVRLRRL